MKKPFILASGSPQRLTLLKQIEMEPEKIIPADIDETIGKKETPTIYVKRMALEKAEAVSKSYPGEVVLSGDTVVVVGRRVIQKSKTAEEQTQVLKLLSGRSHRVVSSVCVIDKNGKSWVRVNSTKVKVKRFSEQEIKYYIENGEWQGVAGFKIDGIFSIFIEKIIGSYSGVVGLPLFETKNLLNNAGIK